MSKLNWRVVLGVLLLVLGVLGLLQTTGLITFEGEVWLWVFAAIFAVAGLAFLYVLITSPKDNWWAAIPGLSLLGLGVLMVLVELPGVAGEWPPAERTVPAWLQLALGRAGGAWRAAAPG